MTTTIIDFSANWFYQVSVFALYLDNFIRTYWATQNPSIPGYRQNILQNFKSMFSMKYGPLVFFNQYYLQLGKSKAKKLKTQKGKDISPFAYGKARFTPVSKPPINFTSCVFTDFCCLENSFLASTWITKIEVNTNNLTTE